MGDRAQLALARSGTSAEQRARHVPDRAVGHEHLQVTGCMPQLIGACGLPGPGGEAAASGQGKAVVGSQNPDPAHVAWAGSGRVMTATAR